jgi:pentatricopeptide repeat protein
LGSLNYAEKLFDTVDIPRNSLIMYATMIKAYANFGNPKEAFVFFIEECYVIRIMGILMILLLLVCVY